MLGKEWTPDCAVKIKIVKNTDEVSLIVKSGSSLNYCQLTKNSKDILTLGELKSNLRALMYCRS